MLTGLYNPIVDRQKRKSIFTPLDRVLYDLEMASRNVRIAVFLVRMIPLCGIVLFLVWSTVWVAQQLFFPDSTFVLLKPSGFKGEYQLLVMLAIYMLCEAFVRYRDLCRNNDAKLTTIFKYREDFFWACRCASNPLGYFTLTVFTILVLVEFEVGRLDIATFFMFWGFVATASVLRSAEFPRNYHYSDWDDIAWKKGFTTLRTAAQQSIYGIGHRKNWP